MADEQSSQGLSELLRSRMQTEQPAMSLPSLSQSMLENWDGTGRREPRMSAYVPTSARDKMADLIGSGLEYVGVSGRTAMDYGHRGAGLADSLTGGLPYLAHNTGADAANQARHGNMGGAAASLLAGAALAAAPAGLARYLMNIPGGRGLMERSRDAMMVDKLKSGPEPIFPPGKMTSDVLTARTPDAYGPPVNILNVLKPSEAMGAIRHPGFEPSQMNRAGGVNQINGNTPLPHEDLRRLYPAF